MAQPVRIALDAMGGDFGPKVTIAGAAIALKRQPGAHFLLFGDEAAIRAELDAFPELAANSTVRHASVSIRMDDKPSAALRYGRRVSSMWLAIEAVKKGEADAAISAGNTGALMAMAKICLRTIVGIDRPALAALWPTQRGQSIVLDVGASIGASAQQLVDLAIMGSAMARIILHLERPSVGLLNVGVEEIKGVEEVKAASRALKEAALPDLDYRGFVEGDDIGQGVVDVVVTEGFTGNIALKTAEGTATQIKNYLARRWAVRSLPSSAICWRAALSRSFAPSSTRATSMAACFSGSTASSSRAMATWTPRASPGPSRSATRWCADSVQNPHSPNRRARARRRRDALPPSQEAAQ